MKRLNWTAPALEDLRAMDGWLSRERGKDFALRTLAEMRLRASFLQDFPHGGRPMRHELRVLRVPETPYLIIYRLVADDLQVLRIRHEREDWQVEV